MPPFSIPGALVCCKCSGICSKPAERTVKDACDRCVRGAANPARSRSSVQNSRSIPWQVSETKRFFVSRQWPITARKQRNNSSGTAEDPKHFGPNSILFVPMAGAGCTLFVLANADVKPSANAGFARLDAPGRGTAGGRLSAGSDHSGRVAGRVGSACDRGSTPSGLRRWAKPPKSLFMSNVGLGTRFDARPRVWPGLLSPVTSTDEP